MSHNSNIHAKLKRMLVLLMAFVIVFTYMPSEAFANTNAWREGSAAYFKNGSTLVGGDGKKYESTYSSSYRHSYVLAPVGGGTNVRAYCLQRMIMNPSSGNVKYKATTWSAADKISSYSQGKQEGIMLALLYGAQPDLSVSDMKKLFGAAANGANKDDWWIATQMIIWDFEQGHRSSRLNLSA